MLRRVAAWIAPVLDVIPALDDLLPGGRPVVWALVDRRRRRCSPRSSPAARCARAHDGGARRRRGRARTRPRTPTRSSARARAAAARGDHELALRLGFRAGLARLDRRGVIELRPSLSTGEVARAVHSPAFDRAAARFDEVVYGGPPGRGRSTSRQARAAWAEALASGRAA